jgi:cob(I)alamin adenosyltransferase
VKIYTRTGDDGSTGLVGGDRVPKSDARPEAYGTVDELNTAIGVLVSALTPEVADVAPELQRVQSELMSIGSRLATPSGSDRIPGLKPVGREHWEALEAAIDRMLGGLPEIRGFILPGGHQTAALAHAARAVCRRLERRVVALSGKDEQLGEIPAYLNRLSDYLFALARYINHCHGVSETPVAGE